MHPKLSLHTRWRAQLTALALVGITTATAGCPRARTNLDEISAEPESCLHGTSKAVTRTGTGTNDDPDIVRFVLVVDTTINGQLRQMDVAVELLRGAPWWRAKEGPIGGPLKIECQVREDVTMDVCGGYSDKRPNLFIARRLIDTATRVQCP